VTWLLRQKPSSASVAIVAHVAVGYALITHIGVQLPRERSLMR
jgi:hypothetical protein